MPGSRAAKYYVDGQDGRQVMISASDSTWAPWEALGAELAPIPFKVYNEG